MPEREVKVRLVGDADQLRKVFGKAATDADGFGNKMHALGGKVSKVGKGLSVGLTLPLLAFAGASIKALAEVDQGMKQTAAVIKSTGGAAHVSGKEVDALAQNLEGVTAVDSEVIRSGENMLLTFTNIQNQVGKGNDIFRQATATAVDMSVALGQDMNSSAIQLGKALNDPIKGITALQRVGVSFTEDQKKQITTLVKHGKTLQAQKIILAELNKEFGGSGKANADSFAGSMFKVKDAVEDMGKALFSALLPHLKTAAAFIANLANKFQSLSPHAQKMILLAVGIAAALGPVIGIVGKIISVIGLLSKAFMFLSANPIVLIIAAVIAAGIAIYIFRDKVAAALAAVGRFFVTLWHGISQAFRTGVAFVVDVFLGMIGTVIHAAASAFGWIPGIGPKLREAARKFDEFRNNVNNAIKGIIPDYKIKITAFTVLPGGQKITARASGGPVFAGRPYLVGEEGPEMFVPPNSGTIVPNGAMRSRVVRGGDGAAVHIHFHRDVYGLPDFDRHVDQAVSRAVALRRKT